MNFPPSQDYATRSVGRYNAETSKIDAIVYRVTDRRHTDAMIAAHNRGVAVRLITENNSYRDPKYLWDSWNVDRMYAAGIPIQWRGHTGENHEKLVLLYGQGMSIFGSSNWTTASANSQQEHNYFTTKTAFFNWFVDQFERKWNNSNPIGAIETKNLVPLPPDKPVYQSPADMATGRPTSGMKLVWYGGPWAHTYDVYFGSSATPPLFAADRRLGPSETTGETQSYALPTLSANTTYYWKIVSKTAAGKTATSSTWTFTTGS